MLSGALTSATLSRHPAPLPVRTPLTLPPSIPRAPGCLSITVKRAASRYCAVRSTQPCIARTTPTPQIARARGTPARDPPAHLLSISTPIQPGPRPGLRRAPKAPGAPAICSCDDTPDLDLVIWGPRGRPVCVSTCCAASAAQPCPCAERRPLWQPRSRETSRVEGELGRIVRPSSITPMGAGHESLAYGKPPPRSHRHSGQSSKTCHHFISSASCPRATPTQRPPVQS